MNLFLVIGSPTVATPLQSIANLVVSNGSALRTVPEMTTTTMTTMMNFLMPQKS